MEKCCQTVQTQPTVDVMREQSGAQTGDGVTGCEGRQIHNTSLTGRLDMEAGGEAGGEDQQDQQDQGEGCEGAGQGCGEDWTSSTPQLVARGQDCQPVVRCHHLVVQLEARHHQGHQTAG